jgi:hypothetical protein
MSGAAHHANAGGSEHFTIMREGPTMTIAPKPPPFDLLLSYDPDVDRLEGATSDPDDVEVAEDPHIAHGLLLFACPETDPGLPALVGFSYPRAREGMEDEQWVEALTERLASTAALEAARRIVRRGTTARASAPYAGEEAQEALERWASLRDRSLSDEEPSPAIRATALG